MKQKTGRKLLSFLLTLAMLVGLMPGMSLTAYAATSHGITINTAQHGTVTASVNGSAATSAEEGATVTLTANPDNGYRLKSISGTYKGNPQETKGLNGTKTINGTYFNLSATDAAGAGWSLKNNSTITITSKDSSVKIDKVDFNIQFKGSSFNLNNVSCSAGTKSLNGNTLSVSSINSTTVTLSSSANSAGTVRFNSVTIYGTGAVDTNLSISTTGDVNVRTFTMPADVQGDVTITPVFEEIPKYNVTLNGGANATTSGGNTTQTGVTGAMTTVTYTANSGFHFTEFANITNNGITATRTSDTAVTVSGTPTADASITIPDAVADAVAVTGVTLNPSAAQTIDVDGKVSFTATVAPDDATDKKVKWSVGGTDTGAVKLYSDEACTTEVGADATETLTVYAKGISAGSATVTATSNADSEKKASCDVTVNAAQTQTETLLTTITATAKEQASYSTANVATVSFSYTAGGSSAYLANWGWWGYGWSATVNAAEGYTITKCIFYDDANRTDTDSSSPFVVETTEEDKTPRINGTPIDGGNYQSKGIKKIEVYGYATPASSYSVTITAGDHMTKTAGSGDAEQTGLTGAMTDVVYTADNGYYYPTDYSVAEVSGIKVTRDSYTQITVSGTPTADAAIALTAPTAKTTPEAPTTATAVDCTTADNNDGKLTGVTAAMEYKKSDAADWTAGTGSDITGLVPGTYYVRVKATETTNASTNQELTIKGFILYTVTFKVVNGKWNEGEGDAATADKTVTLTGHDGDTLKLTADQIPAIGTKPNDTYKAGSWDKMPSAETEITGATTYTYTYAQKDSISQTVTFKVANGKWDDDTTSDKTVTLTGYEGDTLKLAATDIPAVGTKPNDTYKAGSWDVLPSTDTAITADTTYTYTYAQKDSISQTVTFKVANGKWDDDTTSDKTVTLTGYEGDTLKLAATDIPAVGTKPNDTYKVGSWDVMPSTDTAITADTTYTYTYAQKDSISQTVTFKVANGKWDDDTTSDKTVTLTGYEGDTLKLAATDIPAVGTKPNDTYKAGSWDVLPSTDTAITADTTYTYTYAQKDSISQTVTFKVANGKWDDDTTSDKTVTLTGYEGDTLKLAATDIPAVGTKPNDTYKAGSWDVMPSTDTAITEATTYTYTYVAKEASVVTKAPEAKTLTYNGSAQELVTAGEASGGEMQYALGTKDAATEPYTTSIPSKTNAGTYYVWYKAVGDANHNDSAASYVTAKILEASQPQTEVSQTQTEASQTQTEASAPAAQTERITIPKAPAKVKAKTKKNSIRVSWNKIKKNKKTKALRAMIKNVEVQYSTDPGFQKEATVTRIIKKNKTKLILRGLTRKTLYYVRVRYLDGAGGYSRWSRVKKARTK